MTTQTLEQLNTLAERALEARDYRKAQDYAWQQLDIDNLRESAVRQLMTALARSGQRSAAMAQYEIYSKRLAESLGAKPSAELAELYGNIQNEELQQTVLRSRIQVPSDTAEINPIFCYTDIESSTRLWDEHRQAMFGALMQHNDLCEVEIERFQGRILHPTGDGFLIVFEQNDPLAFAISLQQQFAQADWGEIGELRIRIGLHGSTADQEGHEFFREGAWYRGSILNHAARISDTGHGGQIVASPFVKEHCPLPPGASWIDLGRHALKSLDDQQQILGLMHPDLPLKEFPPLRTPDNKKAAQTESKIRGYQLGQKIGQGAFGDVYRAVQPGIGRPVAVKIIRSLYANQPEFIRRFEAEAQVIARLEHPNIVPLYDYWRESDGAFLVMRFMRGGSLEGLLQEGPLELTTALSYLDQVGAALNFAHSQGYVHRDIKPANILLDEQGNAYLSDFGIVKDISSSSQQTQTGAVVGSPAYLSPEQALSQPVTMLSDQYSLAVTLYEMLTGERAFTDSSPATLIVKHLNDPLPLVRAARPELPAAVDECIQRATAKEPSARYPDILAMLRALHTAAGTEGTGYALPTALLDPERELVNPYHGLRSFQEADAVSFFGRKALVEQLLTHFESKAVPVKTGEKAIPFDRFLAVVGPSGSGKSSVVKAGLLPALRNGAVPGSDKWFIVEMIPGTHPLEELEAALLRIAVNPPASLLEQLEKDDRGLVRALKRVLPADASELLLVIDQFEELYTLVEDDDRRAHFINSLLAALNDHSRKLRVVVTLRADFYDRPLTTPGLADLMRSCMEIVPPLKRAELEEVIVQPALQVGAMFEAGLVPSIIDDVGEQPGALPLLQYALTELFERRKERLLTLAAYEEIGGVLGALGRRAEELYAGLDEAGQEAARQLFMRLVTLGEGTEDTRRRVLRSEVMALQTSEVSKTSEVLDAYGRYRLLTFDHDPLTREPTVEVAHEALLRDWERLRTWLDESRHDVRLQRQLAAFAAEWSANEQEEGFLLRGSRLDLLASWTAGTTLALTPEEQAFLRASTAAREQRRAAELERQQRELETAQNLAREQTQRAEEQSRSARRLQLLVAGLAVVLLLAIGAAWLAVSRGQEAQANADLAVTREAEAVIEAEQRATAQAEAVREREIAEQQTLLTTSRELALAALTTLDIDPELSILLAQEALSLTHTREAEEALHRAIPASRTRLVFGTGSEKFGGLAITADGRKLVTMDTPWAEGGGVTRVWDAVTGEELLTLESQNGGAGNLAVSPDGKRVATLSKDDTVRVWDIDTGEKLLQINGHDGVLGAVAFSPDGTLLATGGEDGFVKLWDMESAAEVLSIAAHSEWISDIKFSPDGSRLVSGSWDGSARSWDPVTGQELLAFTTGDLRKEGETQIGTIIQTAFSPDGSLVAAVGDQSMLGVWDAESGEVLMKQQVHTSETWAVAFSPDGSQLATAGEDGKAKLWDLASGNELLTLAGHDDRIRRIAFTPDGTGLITASYDGTARVWDISPSHELLTIVHDGVTRVDINRDGSRIAGSSYFGPAWIWDAESGELLHTLEGHTDFIGAVEFSPDGNLLATGSNDTTAKIWDVESGQELMTLSGHEDFINDVALGPDSNYLATAGKDGSVNIWDLNSGLLVAMIDVTAEDEFGPLGIDFSPDGDRLAISSANNIEIWNADGSELLSILEGHEDYVQHIIFGSVGAKLASSSLNGVVKIWDLENEEELMHIDAHNSPITGMVLNPDWSMLATAAGDTSVKYWDTSTGERLLTLTGHDDTIFDLAMNPDGKSLISASSDYTIRTWVLPLEDLITLGEARVTRALTTEECRQYLHLDACPLEE